LNSSSVNGGKDGPQVNPQRHWCIMVNEATNLKFSDFYQTKDGMVEPILTKWSKWQGMGFDVNNVRLDYAGKNKKLQTRAKYCDWKFAIKWELTARDTPQQNHLVEVGFAVLANRERALMHMAHIPKKMRYQIVPKAFKMATVLNGLVEDKGQSNTRYERFFGKNPKFVNHLRTFGEVAQ
jgi:hypothetical protein